MAHLALVACIFVAETIFDTPRFNLKSRTFQSNVTCGMI